MKADTVFIKDPRWTELQLQCREYRLQGLTYPEIAEKVGKPSHTVRNTCVRIGMPCSEEEIERAQNEGHKKRGYSDEDIERMLRKNEQEFELVRVYGNSDGYVELRCLWCGNIIRKSMQQVRKGARIQCSHCKQGGEWDRLQKEIDLISKKFDEARRAERRKIKKPSIAKQCKQCGKWFLTTNVSAVCCSKECTRKQQNRNADDRLNKTNVIDKDITLEKLFKRDGGKCYLCGGKCDWNDFRRTDNAFIAGDDYPSIDHVVPLAKGGKHQWSNVRLAHRKCNSLKSDSIAPYQKTPIRTR